jgi:hypothetical protein
MSDEIQSKLSEIRKELKAERGDLLAEESESEDELSFLFLEQALQALNIHSLSQLPVTGALPVVQLANSLPSNPKLFAAIQRLRLTESVPFPTSDYLTNNSKVNRNLYPLAIPGSKSRFLSNPRNPGAPIRRINGIFKKIISFFPCISILLKLRIKYRNSLNVLEKCNVMLTKFGNFRNNEEDLGNSTICLNSGSSFTISGPGIDSRGNTGRVPVFTSLIRKVVW